MKPPTWMPGARALASYRRAWLRHDLVAGLVLSTLLVPQGMAYAQLAGLPPITGLYTTVICLVGYAVFGPSLAQAEPRPRWIVIAAEPITDVDTTAADMLAELDEELNAAGTSLVFAELKDPVRAKLERYELIGPLDPAHFFRTLEGAVEAFREETGAVWRESSA
jgi:MFS superfamily sulfate permease-like transporter